MDDSRTWTVHTRHDAHTARHLTSLYTRLNTATVKDKRGKKDRERRERTRETNTPLSHFGTLTGKGTGRLHLFFRNSCQVSPNALYGSVINAFPSQLFSQLLLYFCNGPVLTDMRTPNLSQLNWEIFRSYSVHSERPITVHAALQPKREGLWSCADTALPSMQHCWACQGKTWYCRFEVRYNSLGLTHRFILIYRYTECKKIKIL